MECKTGIAGLDEVLGGGLPCEHLYVVQGEPGTGKTTLALTFLQAGAAAGDSCLYVTFSETKEEIHGVAKSHGWDLSKIHIVDFSAFEEEVFVAGQNTLFHASEMELGQLSQLLKNEVDRLKPKRIVIDSVSELRILAGEGLRYRRLILELKQYFAKRATTVLLLDDLTQADRDEQVQSIAHGVINLSRLEHEFGGERRRVRILKMRGKSFVSGYHDYAINRGGLEVYPRMVSSAYAAQATEQVLASRSAEFNQLLGGGIDYGTSTLFIGPAGSGKTNVLFTFILSALEAGKTVAHFSFEEGIDTILTRARGQGVDLSKFIEERKFFLQKVDPAELSPGQFSAIIRGLVEKRGVSVIGIDSLNGYIHSMPQEQFLSLQLHELLAYLNGQKVATFMTLAQQGLIGTMQSPVDLTYLADTVLLSRYFEASGAVKKAISVIKKRTGKHEETIRELSVQDSGIKVGAVLAQFSGILTGVPKFHGPPSSISKD